ncbi:hypothetical protein [Escherichia coli]|uniref:hypothetical protein n=1 Tax=Escherichia coli TaxID=562 RepID=UPI00138989AE|nr:hypothetical protein [Escherichia coli]HAP2069440.1 hypothetical protein [Escherichia coli]HAP2175217.1 hypothetical protein [Escherichia coli]
MSTRHPVIVFPAPAGINRYSPDRTYPGQCVPRASGDKPGVKLFVTHTKECSPRQRG